jgi:hypothetical protein
MYKAIWTIFMRHPVYFNLFAVKVI